MDPFVQLVTEIKAEFPKFKIVLKSESAFMRLLAFLLKVITFGAQKTFLVDYTTTIGTTVYVPADWNAWVDERRIPILRHERVHMRQAKKWSTPLFFFLYLLFPLPLGLAYFRARFEWEAYEETMRAQAEIHGTRLLSDERFRDSIVKNFTSGAYAWMWPFKSKVEAWYAASRVKIIAERASA